MPLENFVFYSLATAKLASLSPFGPPRHPFLLRVDLATSNASRNNYLPHLKLLKDHNSWNGQTVQCPAIPCTAVHQNLPPPHNPCRPSCCIINHNPQLWHVNFNHRQPACRSPSIYLHVTSPYLILLEVRSAKVLRAANRAALKRPAKLGAPMCRTTRRRPHQSSPMGQRDEH